jgi:cytochrome c-type biogenesis protein CcmH
VIVRAAIVAVLIAGAAAADKTETVPAGSPTVAGTSALDARLKRLEGELRCLVCQNQTLADSNADLADDLRREVRALALQGKSDQEIKSYLVARYGDFVLYNPPVKPLTWVLWFGPFALLAGGGAIWWVVLRRRSRVVPAASSGGEAKGRAMLDGEEESRDEPKASPGSERDKGR